MKSLRIALLFLLLNALSYPEARAGQSEALLFRGVGKALNAVLSIPAGMASGAARSGFPFGLITGVVEGTVSAVGNTISGAFDLARGGAPYAKYALLA